MNRLEECLRFTMSPSVEGGYSNDSVDRGGPTNLGVTQKSYNAWRGRQNLPLQPVNFIERGEAIEIYRGEYWTGPRFADLPRPLDLVCFDAGVNCGPARAAKFLQRALGVSDDGVIGNQTLAAAVAASAEGYLEAIVKSCCDERRGHYDRLCKADPTQIRFYHGWLNRVEALEKLALKELTA